MDTEAALLAAIAGGAPGAHEVYADWLVERGDPRGEFIHVQLAREAAPADRALETRERELLAAHRGTWLPVLEQFWLDRVPEVTWRRGFIDRATFGSSYQGDSAQGYADVAGSPLARFVRELEFHAPYSHHGDGPDDDMIVEALLHAPPPPTLRTLELTCGDGQRAWSHLGNISRMFPLIPGVENFRIDVGRVELGAIALPSCRALTVINSGMRAHVLRDLAATTWPHLERLELFFGNADYGADYAIEDVARLLAGDFPALGSLALTGCELGDDLAQVLVQVPLIRQLRTLDLWGSTMGTVAAEALLAHADQLAHLESLDLSENFFRPAEAEALHQLCRGVVIGKQNEEIPDWGRYVDGAE